MKKPIINFFNHQKLLLTIGLVVSLLILFQKDIYSNTEIKEHLPNVKQLQETVSQRMISSESSDDVNLSNGNFIAAYINVVSNRPAKETEEKCDKQTALSTLKCKVVKIFSAI